MSSYVSAWSEQEVHRGKQVGAFVVILRTGGCTWYGRSGGCIMCGYNTESSPTDADSLITQFTSAMDRHDGEELIKIYTSGSFLDPEEVPVEARDAIFETASERAGHILIESRPEFIHGLDGLPDASLEVAVGLETADDRMRSSCVRKGFTFADYERSAVSLREKGIMVRTYLLLKPPFLTEKEAMDDTRSSIRTVSDLSDVISINPVNVQRGTGVERLWQEGRYSPPWLWSLIEVLRTETDARLISSPSGGGKRRGVHNCGKCDDGILNGIKRFSLGADPGELSASCDCHRMWFLQLEQEGYAHSEGIDYRRDDDIGTIPLVK